MRKPWFREQNATWYFYCNREKRQVSLGTDKKAAFEEWHRRNSIPAPDAPNAPLVTIFDAYANHLARNNAKATLKLRLLYIKPFCRQVGHLPAASLKKFHLTEWLDSKNFKDGARRGAIVSIKAALNWAESQDLIDANPLNKYQAPSEGRREQLVSEADQKRILAHAGVHYRLVVQALRHTGCRPFEVRTVDAAKFHGDSWVFPPAAHKTGKKTGRKRVVHLTPCMVTLTRILAHHRPTGPLFLNSVGGPWTCNAIRVRMLRLRKTLDLPAGTVAYSFRHTFTTDGIANGMPSITMATLLGHGNTAMIDKHYGHLDQRGEHLQKALADAHKKRGK
jgi:integrase